MLLPFSALLQGSVAPGSVWAPISNHLFVLGLRETYICIGPSVLRATRFRSILQKAPIYDYCLVLFYTFCFVVVVVEELLMCVLKLFRG